METKSKVKFKPDPKLMAQVRQMLLYQYYAYRTEQVKIGIKFRLVVES